MQKSCPRCQGSQEHDEVPGTLGRAQARRLGGRWTRCTRGFTKDDNQWNWWMRYREFMLGNPW